MGEHSFLLKLHLEHEAYLRQMIAQLQQRIYEETDGKAKEGLEQYKKNLEQELKYEEQELRKLSVYDLLEGKRSMTKTEPCAKQACGFWGIPLKKLGSLKDLSDDKFECCLRHESREKCSRNPRFLGDPSAEDYFDPVPDELQDKEDW